MNLATLLPWDAPDPVVYVSPRTWEALAVEPSGNAKARRRWRRRNLPNTQRPMAGQEQWARTRIARASSFVVPIDMELDGRPAIGLKGGALP